MEVDDTPEDEHSYDLFWHALNYRGAAIQHAEGAWIELQACVQRLIDQAKEEARSDEADAARDWYERQPRD